MIGGRQIVQAQTNTWALKRWQSSPATDVCELAKGAKINLADLQ
jgi:hypothetical protein